jgi:hypothetical protein
MRSKQWYTRAEQRAVREGSSPSGARMRSAISKSGGNASLARGVEGMEKPKRARRRKPETAKVDLKPPLGSPWRAGCPSRGGIRRACREVPGRNRGGYPEDELVGRKVGQGRACVYEAKALLIHPSETRCLRTARYGRTARDLRRTGRVSGWHRSKQTYK